MGLALFVFRLFHRHVFELPLIFTVKKDRNVYFAEVIVLNHEYKKKSTPVHSFFLGNNFEDFFFLYQQTFQ